MEERIKDVQTLLLDVPLERPVKLPAGNWSTRQNLIVIVETSSGRRGFGEIWVNFPPWRCHDRIALVHEVLAPLLRDEPVDDPRRLYRLMVDGTAALRRRWAAMGPVHHAIAGLDLAVWDAFARSRSKPISSVLAEGSVATTLPVYASGIGPGGIGEAIDRALVFGHTRFKVRLVEGPERDAVTLRQAREAAGRRSLMADPSESYDPDSIGDLWPAIQATQLAWLEEPFPSDDVAAHKDFMMRRDRPPLALGESVYGRAGFDAMSREIDPEVVQPDITKTGGFSESVAVGREIARRGRQLCFHMLGGPIGFLASAHAAAAIPAYDLLELEADLLPHFPLMLGGGPEIADGRFTLPTGPGLGVEPDFERVSDWIVRDAG